MSNVSITELDRRLEQIDRQIASVERRRSFGDTSVDFASYKELRDKRDHVQSQRDAMTGKKRRRVVRLNADKGL